MIRPAWAADSNDEAARAYLQARLDVYSNLMFWSFVVLIVFLTAMYNFYDRLRPEANNQIFVAATLLLALMAGVWRLLLVRRSLSIAALHRIDLIYALVIGTSLAAGGFFASRLQSAAWCSFIFACLAVFTRALVVPSSARWTIIVSTLVFLPIALMTVGLSRWVAHELPTPALIGGNLVISVVVVLLAAKGSQIIYGLTRQVSVAKQLGQYTLDGKIGAGGMGEVHRAHHIMLRRPTAVKLLLPDHVGAENLERFEREVQVMSLLTHPNTVAIFDYGRTPEGTFYYAMEYLGGGIDLEQLVRKYGPQPAGRVVHILAQVCGALNEAHRRGLIHRDIKPANIILCERGDIPDVAKVVDFGLVKEFTAATGASTQVVLGTPAYVAPETLTDPDRVGPAVDLYALGAVAYFLLTGKRVFEGKTAIDVCLQHVTTAPKPMSEVSAIHIPQELEHLVMACLSKQPKDRPGSAAELAKLMRALPSTSDWTDGEAETWWQEFRAAAAVPVVDAAPTLTLTVDWDHGR
jgi:eukaryotic-like serine/threonine-protein kinase